MTQTSDNRIFLRDTPDQILQKCSRLRSGADSMYRDSDGTRQCQVFTLHKVVSDTPTVERMARECTQAATRCLDCKEKLARTITVHLEPLRARIDETLAESGFKQQRSAS